MNYLIRFSTKILIINFFLLFVINISSAQMSFNSTRANAFCKEKWSTRGVVDERMYSYCLSEQREGFENAKYFLRQNIQRYNLLMTLLIMRLIAG